MPRAVVQRVCGRVDGRVQRGTDAVREQFYAHTGDRVDVVVACQLADAHEFVRPGGARQRNARLLGYRLRAAERVRPVDLGRAGCGVAVGVVRRSGCPRERRVDGERHPVGGGALEVTVRHEVRRRARIARRADEHDRGDNRDGGDEYRAELRMSCQLRVSCHESTSTCFVRNRQSASWFGICPSDHDVSRDTDATPPGTACRA